jgi:hypothetical protein
MVERQRKVGTYGGDMVEGHLKVGTYGDELVITWVCLYLQVMIKAQPALCGVWASLAICSVLLTCPVQRTPL